MAVAVPSVSPSPLSAADAAVLAVAADAEAKHKEGIIVGGIAVGSLAAVGAAVAVMATKGAATTAVVAANAASGMRLYWSTGTNFVAQGKVRVYGYQN